MTCYVALLRGINVGGNNLIRMADLKACFVDHGFSKAATYIASGNVVFASDESDRVELVRRIEKMLGATFRYPASVVLRNQKQMREIVDRAPKGFGASPAKYRYYVIFLKEPLRAAAAIKSVPVKDGVDQAHAGPGVLYHSRLNSKATQSRLSRIVGLPVYQSMTIRNWNTTTRLLQMMEGLDQ
jgi:uncharacterized protein (DUF1697 family)